MDCDCVARQAPLFMEFSGQEYWNGLPFPPPGDLSDPGIEPGSPALQANSLPTELPRLLYIHMCYTYMYINFGFFSHVSH